MADSKITALTALTAADPANDMMPIVDVSDTSMAASGTTKRISINNILACSPSATLASLNVTGSSIPANGLYLPTTNTLEFSANGLAQYRIAPLGVFSWYDGAGGTRMTLNSTGLGVGRTPATYKFEVLGNAQVIQSNFTDVAFRISQGASTSGNKAQLLFTDSSGTIGNITSYGSAYGGGVSGALAIGTGGTDRLTVDSSGNVGIGVTPSAWNNSYNVLEIGQNGSISGRTSTNNQVDIVSNGFRNSGGTWVYKLATSNAAARYLIDGSVGSHSWYSGVAGTAGNTIAGFSTASMTLDASGNLLVGTTSALSAWATRLTLSTDAGTTKWAVGPYAATTNFIISASGSFGVYLNGTSAVSWTGISDERLKDIIEPISNAVAKVGKLRSVIGKFKADETNTRRSFLLAQDVQAVLPEAVDASNPDRLGVAYTDVIPLLVAAIKELTARVQTLEAK